MQLQYALRFFSTCNGVGGGGGGVIDRDDYQIVDAFGGYGFDHGYVGSYFGDSQIDDVRDDNESWC